MVLDDGQRLEGLPQSHAVGDDAAAETVELVDGADDAVALELEELLPHDRVADSRGGLDDLLRIQFVGFGAEDVVQNQRVDAMRVVVGSEGSQQLHDTGLGGFVSGQRGPLAVEPLAQSPALFRCFRRVDEVQRVSRSETQTVGAERERAEHGLPRSPVPVAQDDGALRDGAVRSADFGRLLDPVGTAAGQPAALEPVARGAVRVGPEEAKLRLFGRQHETHVGHVGQLVGEFRECMEGQRFRSQIHSDDRAQARGWMSLYHANRFPRWRRSSSSSLQPSAFAFRNGEHVRLIKFTG